VNTVMSHRIPQNIAIFFDYMGNNSLLKKGPVLCSQLEGGTASRK